MMSKFYWLPFVSAVLASTPSMAESQSSYRQQQTAELSVGISDSHNSSPSMSKKPDSRFYIAMMCYFKCPSGNTLNRWNHL